MKLQKVYIAIAIYRDGRMPEIVEVYGNRKDAEKNAYAFSTTDSWINIIEKVVK